MGFSRVQHMRHQLDGIIGQREPIDLRHLLADDIDPVPVDDVQIFGQHRRASAIISEERVVRP